VAGLHEMAAHGRADVAHPNESKLHNRHYLK
jgi:hypothetical protein